MNGTCERGTAPLENIGLVSKEIEWPCDDALRIPDAQKSVENTGNGMCATGKIVATPHFQPFRKQVFQDKPRKTHVIQTLKKKQTNKIP